MVEFIGLIISIFALFYLFIKQKAPPYQKEGPPKYRSEREIRNEKEMRDQRDMDDPFKEFLKSIGSETLEEEQLRSAPPPKKKSHPKKVHSHTSQEPQFNPAIKEKQSKSPWDTFDNVQIKSKSIHQSRPVRAIALPISHPEDKKKEALPSRLQSAVGRLSHRRDMIIYQEIMDKPKSLRSETFLP
jgi:hypothetical protein